ncbi:MAG: transglutaminase-like domain-containing protein [Gammaproteobacteria bacterium]|nr:transglutaminase-like domain-containing protein [Gammaproteobacteria bacterium]MDH5799756.1 transglutaminase-like domain-containing protein [Gammaproteobacteria bacterium]
MSEATSKTSVLFPYPCPMGVLGVAVLLWSWYCGIWPIGVAMAILLELPRWLPFRFPLKENHFIRLANISTIILILCTTLFFVFSMQQSIFLLMQWMPLLLFLILLGQLYSSPGLLPLKAVVAVLRKPGRAQGFPQYLDLRLPYLLLVLVAGSMAAPREISFYMVSMALLFWGLWCVRPKTQSALLWLAVGMMAAAMGFFMQLGIQQLQGIVQDAGMEWFQDWSHQNPTRKSTAIGQLGRLKLSNRILMRVKSSEPGSRLLKQASYNRYYGGSWYAADTEFEQLYPVAKDRWLLTNTPPYESDKFPSVPWLQISAYLNKGEGFLALPSGSRLLQNRRTGEIWKNRFGTVQIKNAPGLLDFTVYYDDRFTTAEKTMRLDLELPRAYNQVTKAVVQELGLDRLAPQQALLKLKEYFASHFTYSLVQSEMDTIFQPIHHFLRQSRSGHCEYFATAGALILRAAGLPSRYASGYLMTEYQSSSETYLIRSRHAHAWTQVYVGNRWVDVDFTPSTWAAMEDEAAPWWESVYDVMSYGVFAVAHWWWAKPRSLWDYGLYLLLLLFAYLGVKKLRQLGLRRLLSWKPKLVRLSPHEAASHSASPFQTIITCLEIELAPRRGGETTRNWLQRICRDTNIHPKAPVLSAELVDTLMDLLQQHYQYRFHSGIHKGSEELQRGVTDWLRRYHARSTD